MDRADLSILQNIIKSDIRDFKLAYKDESVLMNILGFFMAPFNSTFMSRYVTTWGDKVYFPSKRDLYSDPTKNFCILAHEYVHLLDAKEHKSFRLTYLFPQVIALVPLIATAILAWPHPWLILLPFVCYTLSCLTIKIHKSLFWVSFPVLFLSGLGLTYFLAGWGTLLGFISMILFLAPWPAPWRVKWELRGYSMNVALSQWVNGNFSDEDKTFILNQFVGPSYFWMSWSRKGITKKLDEILSSVKHGNLQKEHPYGLVSKIVASKRRG
jgi:hypothetical protein